MEDGDLQNDFFEFCLFQESFGRWRHEIQYWNINNEKLMNLFSLTEAT